MFARALAAALLLAGTTPAAPPASSATARAQAAWTARCKDWDEWNKPAPPFHVFGNTYYVGTCGITSVLIETGQGAIVIDGGPVDAGRLIAKNVQALGVKLSDVKLLLHTHEHHDHAGGLAELQRLTGARLLASKRAAPVLASGNPGKDDPLFAYHHRIPPAKGGGIVRDGEVVRLGGLELNAIATPGHTPGALSWQWRSCEGPVCKTLVYADSLTPVSSDDYRFSDHPAYLAAFRASLARVAGLKCDILLSPHPSASGMRDRLLKGDLTDPSACKAYAKGLEEKLAERLAKEARGR